MQNEQILRAQELRSDSPNSASSDDVLAAQGSAAAFIQLYQTHVNAVYRYALARVSNQQDAEDVTADVFKRAWGSLPRYRAGSAFKSWLFTIAQRAVADHYRKHGPPTVSLDNLAELVDPQGQPEDGALTSEQLRQVFAALASLTHDQQEVITLRFLSGLRYEEIADIMHKHESAVKMIAYRALEDIRRRIPNVNDK